MKRRIFPRGIKPSNKKNADLPVSCNLLTLADIRGTDKKIDKLRIIYKST